VSALELYVQCPFKYFARYVLRLNEEVDDQEGLGPRLRGSFVHTVFQTFFERWQAAGRGAITASSLEAAYRLLDDVLAELLPALGPADAGLERTRILGSPVAAGLADVVFTAEALRPVPVVDRRLEDRFEGMFELQTADGSKHVPIRGVVDRIDLLADGTLRVIDYKSSPPYKPVQLAVYAVTSAARLRGERGRDWRVGEVSYIVFGKERAVKPIARGPAAQEAALLEAQHRAAAAIEAIERGEFPPRPVHTHLCSFCAYRAVCRQEYVTQGTDE
jgi:ATP-dependent helicase/DNAse subunit B